MLLATLCLAFSSRSPSWSGDSWCLALILTGQEVDGLLVGDAPFSLCWSSVNFTRVDRSISILLISSSFWETSANLEAVTYSSLIRFKSCTVVAVFCDLVPAFLGLVVRETGAVTPLDFLPLALLGTTMQESIELETKRS